MKLIVHEGVTLSEEEKQAIFKKEVEHWEKKGKLLNTVHIEKSDDENELIVTSTAKSRITRVRRITGYLSNVNNFNSAKKAEMEDRKAHMKASN